jgi:hypothetical protein
MSRVIGRVRREVGFRPVQLCLSVIPVSLGTLDGHAAEFYDWPMPFLSGHICWVKVKHPLCRLEFAGLLAQALKLGKGSSLVRFVTENALDLSQAVGTTRPHPADWQQSLSG